MYVINMYVYMYIHVSAKHACMRRFNINSALNEEEGGLSSIVCWAPQPADPVLCRGLQDQAALCGVLPSLPLFALSQQRPDPGYLGAGLGSATVGVKEPFADYHITSWSRAGAWDG